MVNKRPYNNAIQPAEPRPAWLSLTRKSRRFPQTLSLRAKVIGLVRRLIGRYGPKIFKRSGKEQVAFKLGISKEKIDSLEASKDGTDSSFRPIVCKKQKKCWELKNK
jgi:hypothetical protein